VVVSVDMPEALIAALDNFVSLHATPDLAAHIVEGLTFNQRVRAIMERQTGPRITNRSTAIRYILSQFLSNENLGVAPTTERVVPAAAAAKPTPAAPVVRSVTKDGKPKF
jgi:metal-responsive CopG/Arc/MetJ family transcriptional regulator